MPSKGDIDFGNLALKDKIVTRAQVEESLKYQGEVEAGGAVTTLDRVMMQKGYLNEQQVFELNKKQGRRVVFCTKCQTKLNVAGLAVGQKVKCPKCATTNVTPEKISFELIEKGKAAPGMQEPEVAAKPDTVRMQAYQAPKQVELELGNAGDQLPPDPPSSAKVAVPGASPTAKPAEHVSDAPKTSDEAKGPKKFANRKYGKR